MPVPYFLSNCPPCFFVRCPGLFLTFGPRVWRLMFFCSPAQRKCRHWYIKLIYFCYLPRLVECSPQIIYDIGTKILYFQCFVTTDMFLFCKPIFFSGNCRICRDLAFGSVKTRFKAILKNWIFRPRSTFSWTFAPRGRLRYEAYNVFTFLIYIYITFTLHLHLHFKPCFFVIWPVVIHILDFFIVALPFDFFFWHLPCGVDVLFLYHCPKQTSF